ncbi:MAG: S9 family peptidase [Salibacteraceae bacterium]
MQRSLRILLPALMLAFPIFIAAQAPPEITVRDIWGSRKFSQKSVSGIRSMKDGKHYTRLEDDRGSKAIVKYSYETGEKVAVIVAGNEVVPNKNGKPISIENYEFSADEKKVLIATEVESIYRHSTRASYYVYNLSSKKVTLVSAAGKVRLATFSPAGDKVAFVRENNLFVLDINTSETLKCTQDGKSNSIIYGATDWVYEEEFGFDKGFSWAPDGNTIAYYRFDEKDVPEFSMDMYGELYPQPYTYKYPKAGEPNAFARLFFYDLKARSEGRIDIPYDFEYIPRIKWTRNSSLLCVQIMPRLQNELTYLLANVKDGSVNEILKETSKSYVEITDDLYFLKDGSGFLRSSEKNGYNHIYRYDMQGGSEKQLTKGEWDVTEIHGVDEKGGLVYFTSAEVSPMERHLYSVKLNGSGKKKLTKEAGTNRSVFSSGFQYFINYHQSANTPNFVSLHNSDGKKIRDLETNENLRQTLDKYQFAPKEFFQFTTSQKVTLNGWMIKPRDFDASKKYPVLMYVYGGPGAQTVKETWGFNDLWYQMLANKGYIIVSVDNRGTGARGAEFKKCTYTALGYLETEDQIEGAKYMASQPYVDADRIGIWGWSYGGYMSSLCITKGADVFKTAIAVAPVTNWRYYDTIYTERYMKTPGDNPGGYDDNSPINFVDRLNGNYLLIHGTADDNVHVQNSMEMVNALIAANKQFDFYLYPDRNHGIYGGNTRLHLYNKMTNFILENL